ncbi:hypothetical protein [Mycolicibacterium palauense]|uniref:hypothetical protein n=1 Tax=Mycolicibacterium palauense TaxID=2034511 RepID=UPI000BFF0544|nr:hypothetical protein [Mycolicibacterium palauense]
MSDGCLPDVAGLAGELGFSCADAPAPLRLRHPAELSNWTLPAVDGTTPSGTATGVLGYAAACFVIAALLVTAVFRLRPPAVKAERAGAQPKAGATR